MSGLSGIKKSPLDIDEEVMTVVEIANKLKVKENTVSRWCKEGKFANAFRAGRAWRIPKSDVEAYIEASTRKALRED